MPTRNESLAQFANVTASPGANGNVLTSNGTSWVSAAPAAGLSGQTDSASPYETSLGSGAGAVSTGARNTFVGFEVGNSNSSGVDGCGVGFQALFKNTTGPQNTAVGAYALTLNTTGSGNTALGYYSLAQNLTGVYNTSLGTLALSNATNNNNTAVGTFSLFSLTSGHSNTAIGINAGYSAVTNTNITCVGYDANPSSNSVSNEITLGNASVGTLRCGTTTITSLSDERDKKNITDLQAGLAFINAVRPVAFDWHTRDEAKVDIPDTGFLAQNLQQVQTQLGVIIPGLVYDNNPEKLEAGYSKLLPVLVKAIQELSAEVEALKAQIA